MPSGFVSGTFASTSQLSVSVLPVLVPPWNSTPPCVLALTLKSTPCQYSYCSPYCLENRWRLSVAADALLGLMLSRPVIVSPLVSRRESVGTITLNGSKSAATSDRLSVTVKFPYQRR